MHSEVTEAGPFERLLTVHIEDAELEDAKDTAARKLSQRLKIKGFRPGKAPRSIVERMVGAESLRAEAVDEALPDLVGTAIEQVDLAPAVAPSVRDVRDREDGGVDVDVVITLWPALAEAPSTARTVEVDVPEVEDAQVDAQIDRVRAQYAELEDVSRAADDGDFVLLDLSATSSLGAVIDDVAATDLLYEVGSQSYIPGLDELLGGASAGDITQGPAVLPEAFGDRSGSEVTLRALVKGVKARRLPDLTDEWVSDVSEFETVEELRGQLRASLEQVGLRAARERFRDDLLDQILADVDLAIPPALIGAEAENTLHNLAHSLQSSGLDLPTYLTVTGQDQQQFADQVRADAERSLRVRVLLESVAAAEGIEVGDDELSSAIAEMASSARREPEELASFMAESGQDQVLAGDILRRRALDLIMEAATAVDAEGEQIDLRAPVSEDPDPDEDSQDEAGREGDSPEAATGDTADLSEGSSPEDGSSGNGLLGDGSDDMTPDEEA